MGEFWEHTQFLSAGHRVLRSQTSLFIVVGLPPSEESPSPQDVATSTLEACAPKNDWQSNNISKIDISYVFAIMASVGRTRWAIAEGYIPGESHGPAPAMTSHEACCILNASGNDAHVAITIFFENRDPVGPYRFSISPRRTKHLRFNNFDDPEIIPRDTPYSSLIESDVPIVVQHTRLDSRQAENALLTTVAFPCD